MKLLKKIIAVTTVMAMVGVSANLQADDCCMVGGCEYQECCQSPCLTPAIALGAIAIVAIIAVALQNSHGHHGHGHAHN